MLTDEQVKAIEARVSVMIVTPSGSMHSHKELLRDVVALLEHVRALRLAAEHTNKAERRLRKIKIICAMGSTQAKYYQDRGESMNALYSMLNTLREIELQDVYDLFAIEQLSQTPVEQRFKE